MGFELSDLFIDAGALPDNGYGWVQLLFLGGVYGYILMQGANLIKDGSELLLLIPGWSGLVGSIVLPVLGAVPDGAIVLFSGLGPDAQEQLSVGMGALAGSTIMLLTVPWVLALWGGRVDLDVAGNGNYNRPRGAGPQWRKLSYPRKILGTGVNLGPTITYSAKVMLFTLLPFFVIQIPALVGRCAEKSHCQTPRIAALIGGILAILLFCFYLWDQWRLADSNDVTERKKEDVQHKVVDKHLMSLKAIFAERMAEHSGTFAPPPDQGAGYFHGNQHAAVNAPLLGNSRSPGTTVITAAAVAADEAAFRRFLKPYFRRFDADCSGKLELGELRLLLESVGERPSDEMVCRTMQQVDTNGDGAIDFSEFTVLMRNVVMSHEIGAPRSRRGSIVPAPEAAEGQGEGDCEVESEEDEEEEMPEDLADLSPAQQRRAILRRAFGLMGIGTIVVVFFSDPMVDVLGALGKRCHISPFYVSFVIAPLVSNGSELLAAYAYALKKTEKTISISLATLVGSSAMNNTFCLAIFLFLVYFKKLQWVFTAEVTSIIFVEVLMIGLVHLCGRTMRTTWAVAVAALFPLSIVLVILMENVAGLD